MTFLVLFASSTQYVPSFTSSSLPSLRVRKYDRLTSALYSEYLFISSLSKENVSSPTYTEPKEKLLLFRHLLFMDSDPSIISLSAKVISLVSCKTIFPAILDLIVSPLIAALYFSETLSIFFLPTVHQD